MSGDQRVLCVKTPALFGYGFSRYRCTSYKIENSSAGKTLELLDGNQSVAFFPYGSWLGCWFDDIAVHPPKPKEEETCPSTTLTPSTTTPS